MACDNGDTGGRRPEHRSMPRRACTGSGGVLRCRTPWVILALLAHSLAPVGASAQSRTSLQQVKEAWLAADAVVYGEYEGVDAEAGPAYHRIDVDEVWFGSPSRGPVLFKAPRGIQAEPGDQVLLMLWDELNGSTHAFLEKSRRIYGEELWKTIGPDSITTYLLPFSRFAFVFDDGRIDLGGTNIFGNRVRKRDLREDINAFESEMRPAVQFQNSEVVVQATVTKRDFKIFEVEDVPVELRVHVDFRRQEAYKGDVEETFSIEYGSFPRSPRFEAGETVLMFLSRRADSLILPFGKRSLVHIGDGQVLETGQPLREYLKAMRGL